MEKEGEEDGGGRGVRRKRKRVTNRGQMEKGCQEGWHVVCQGVLAVGVSAVGVLGSLRVLQRTHLSFASVCLGSS